MADGVWKGVQSQVIGRSRQLSLNKFFDRTTPSMRKVDDGKKEKKEKKKEWRFQWPLRHCQQSTARTATPERRPLELRTLVPISTYIAGCLTSSLDVLKTCHVPGTGCLLKMSPCFAKLSLQSISISFSIDFKLFFFLFDPFDPATHPPPPQGKFNFNLEKIQSLRANSRWPYDYSKPTYIQCQHQFKANLRIF